MAAKNDPGINVKVGGEQSFRNALRNISAELRTLDSELKLSSAQFAGQEKSEAAVAERTKILAKEKDALAKKEELLNARLEETKAKYGENSTEAKNLERQINGVKTQTINLDHEMASLNGTTDSTSTAMKDAGDTAAQTGTDMSSSAATAKHGWVVAAAAIVAALSQIVSATKEAISTGLNYNETLETYTTNFSVMLSSEKKGAELVDQLKSIASTTPFELGDLSKATQTLLSFNLSAEGSVDILSMLGDISLGSADKLQTLSRAYGKIYSSGKVTLESINMMIDAGFNPLTLVAQAAGEEISATYARISAGKVTVDEITAAIQTATSAGGQFANGMQKASETVAGLKSTLSDNLGEAAGTALQPLSDALRVDILPKLIATTNTIRDQIAVSATWNGAMTKISTALSSAVSKASSSVVKVAENLASIVAWIAENFEALKATVIGVGAAFVTFKATMAIGSAVQVVVSAIKLLGTANTAATASQLGLNAAMDANPIMLIVSALAALTIGIIAYANSLPDANAETKALRDEVVATRDAINKTTAATEESIDSAEDEKRKLNALTAELDALTSKTTLTAGEQSRLTAIVNTLNDSVDGLNLSYDASTNSVGRTTTAIYSMIEAKRSAAELDALQDAYIEQTASKETALAKLEAARANAEKVRSENAAKAALLTDQEAIRRAATSRDVDAAAFKEARAAQEAIDLADATLAEATLTYSDACTAISDTTAALDDFGAASDAATTAADEQAAAQEALAAAYEWATDRLTYYSGYTQNVFGTITQNAAVSVSDMIANLNANTDAITKWSDDLATLADAGIDDGLLQKLRDAGPEAAATAASLADYVKNGGSLDELNKAYEDAGQAASDAVVSELDTLPDSLAGIGSNSAVGLTDGIMGKIDDIRAAGAAAGNAAIEGAQTALDVHSPSRKFGWLGRMSGVGYINELRSSLRGVGDMFSATVRGIDSAAYSSSAPSSAAPAVAGGATIVNLTVTDPSPAWTAWLMQEFNVQLGEALR